MPTEPTKQELEGGTVPLPHTRIAELEQTVSRLRVELDGVVGKLREAQQCRDALLVRLGENDKEILMLRQDRDHFDEQHRVMLADKNSMQAERDALRQELEKLRVKP